MLVTIFKFGATLKYGVGCCFMMLFGGLYGIIELLVV
jgi:hypothetical protein